MRSLNEQGAAKMRVPLLLSALGERGALSLRTFGLGIPKADSVAGTSSLRQDRLASFIIFT